MKKFPVFTIGVEGRFLPAHVERVGGEEIAIPAHWSSTAIFGGVANGTAKMWAAPTGIVSRGDTVEDARWAIREASRHYPLDGRDVATGYRVGRPTAFSRVERGYECSMREYHLWTPPKDIFHGGVTEVEVEGHVFGLGVGIETVRGKVCAAPYYAARVYEEHADGRKVPIVVPVRWIAPEDPSAILDGDPPFHQLLGGLVQRLRARSSIGATILLAVVRDPVPHYILRDLYEDTAMGQAMKEAGVHTASDASAVQEQVKASFGEPEPAEA